MAEKPEGTYQTALAAFVELLKVPSAWWAAMLGGVMIYICYVSLTILKYSMETHAEVNEKILSINERSLQHDANADAELSEIMRERNSLSSQISEALQHIAREAEMMNRRQPTEIQVDLPSTDETHSLLIDCVP